MGEEGEEGGEQEKDKDKYHVKMRNKKGSQSEFKMRGVGIVQFILVVLQSEVSMISQTKCRHTPHRVQTWRWIPSTAQRRVA